MLFCWSCPRYVFWWIFKWWTAFKICSFIWPVCTLFLCFFHVLLPIKFWLIIYKSQLHYDAIHYCWLSLICCSSIEVSLVYKCVPAIYSRNVSDRMTAYSIGPVQLEPTKFVCFEQLWVGTTIFSKPNEVSDIRFQWMGIYRNISYPIKYSNNWVWRFLELGIGMGISLAISYTSST